MYRLSILGIAILAMVATFAAAAGVRDSTPARAAGFGQATLTRQGSGAAVTVQTGRAGTIALSAPYGTGARNQAGSQVIFTTQAPAAVCAVIGGLTFALQAGGVACVGASDRVYWEAAGGGTRIYATDGSFIDVVDSPAVVAAAIAAVP